MVSVFRTGTKFYEVLRDILWFRNITGVIMETRNIAEQLITYKGETKLLRNWVKDLGLDYVTVRMRYTRGTRGDKLFAPTRFTPRPLDVKAFLGDEDYERLDALAKHLQLSPATVARDLLVRALNAQDTLYRTK